MDEVVSTSKKAELPDEARRAVLRRLGKFAAVTPPAVTLLLVAEKKAVAASLPTVSSRQFKETPRIVDAGYFAGILATGAPADVIDGVGACLAAIKALAQRVNGMASHIG